MNLKQILSEIVDRLESVATTTDALEGLLVANETLAPDEVENHVSGNPNPIVVQALARVRAAIVALPDSP